MMLGRDSGLTSKTCSWEGLHLFYVFPCSSPLPSPVLLPLSFFHFRLTTFLSLIEKCLISPSPHSFTALLTVRPALLFSCAKSCPALWDPMHCSPPGSSVHGIFPGKSTALKTHCLLQRISPTQESNPRPLHWQADSLSLFHLGSPLIPWFQEKSKIFLLFL